MMRKPKKCPQNGPPSELISRVNHLGNLLHNLPETLPLDPPEARCHFGLDAESISEEGYWFAFNQNLEACFKTHKIPPNGTICCQEHGSRYEALIKMFKEVIKALTKDLDRTFLQEVWLEQLIKAAELQGAKVPKRCVLPFTIIGVTLAYNFGRGTKRTAENKQRDTTLRSQPEKRPRQSNTNANTNLESLIERDDDKITSTTPRPIPRHQRVIIELSSNPAQPVDGTDSANHSRQATLDDLTWKSQHLETDEDKQAHWKKEAEKWRDETESD